MENKNDMIKQSDLKEKRKSWDGNQQLTQKIKRREEVIERYRTVCRKYEELCESYREENAKLLKIIETMLRIQEQGREEYQKIFNDVAWTLQSMLGKEKAGKDASYERNKIRQRLREECLKTAEKKEMENYSYFLTNADTILPSDKERDSNRKQKENLRRYKENQEKQKKTLEKYKKYAENLENQRLKQQRQIAYQNAIEILMAFFIDDTISDGNSTSEAIDVVLEEKTGICFRYRDDPEITDEMKQEFVPCSVGGVPVPGIFIKDQEECQKQRGRLVRYGTNVGYYVEE